MHFSQHSWNVQGRFYQTDKNKEYLHISGCGDKCLLADVTNIHFVQRWVTAQSAAMVSQNYEN